MVTLCQFVCYGWIFSANYCCFCCPAELLFGFSWSSSEDSYSYISRIALWVTRLTKYTFLITKVVFSTDQHPLQCVYKCNSIRKLTFFRGMIYVRIHAVRPIKQQHKVGLSETHFISIFCDKLTKSIQLEHSWVSRISKPTIFSWNIYKENDLRPQSFETMLKIQYDICNGGCYWVCQNARRGPWFVMLFSLEIELDGR